ncbi:MAG: (2Fe-2S)-binding protein, partial [Verrucomicrobiae bacterium]|nr:(2Fe-2S)-binding protein [Verrucomicrobiae bacterium]
WVNPLAANRKAFNHRTLSQTMPSMTRALSAPGQSALPLGKQTVKMVCHCLGLTEPDIRESIALLTHPTVEKVGEVTGAGTGCSGCRIRIRRLIEGKPACGRFGPCDQCGACRAVCGCEAEVMPVLCRLHCRMSGGPDNNQAGAP